MSENSDRKNINSSIPGNKEIVPGGGENKTGSLGGSDDTGMSAGRFGKVRRIAALLGVVLLLGIYVVAFIAGIGKWENAHAVFMTAVWMSIAVPAIIYIMLVLYRISQKRKNEPKK